MLRKAIVVETHPEDNSVDLVMSDDGSRLTGVQVVSYGASTRTGVVDLPEIPRRGIDKWDITQRTGQDMEALVGFIQDGNPVVVGFIYPQISQMTFEQNRRFSRHRSDVYTTIDENGNIELFHPSGVYIRIAEDPDHEDLTDRNYDQNLRLDRNTERKLYVRVSVPNSGTFTMDPDGNATLDMMKTITLQADGGSLVVRRGGVYCNPDVFAGSVSLRTHRHTGVEPGPGLSGPPQGGGSASS